MTLYPKIVDASEISTGVFVNGTEVSPIAGTVSGDGWSYTNRVITFCGSDKTFTVFGTNMMNQVSLVLGGTNTFALANLDLTLSSVPGNGKGVVAVPPGCKADVEIGGNVILDPSTVANVAGIHCPTGATVRIWSQIDRGITGSFDGATRITSAGRAALDLTVHGGANAAAIGGRSGEPCGKITLDAVNVCVGGGANAMDIGNGYITDVALKKIGESVVFVNTPMVVKPDGTVPLDIVPRPHNEYGRPLIGRAGSGGEVFFVPTGTTTYNYSGTESTWNVFHSDPHSY